MSDTTPKQRAFAAWVEDAPTLDTPMLDWVPRPRALDPRCFRTRPVSRQPWLWLHDHLMDLSLLLERWTDAAWERAWHDEPNPDFDPAIAETCFPSRIVIGQSYHPRVAHDTD